MDTNWTRQGYPARERPDPVGDTQGVAAPTAVLLVDQRGSLVAMDAAAQQWLGCLPQDALQAPVTRFIPASAWQEALRRVQKTEDSDEAARLMPEGVSTVARRADGGEWPVVLRVSQLTPSEGGMHRGCLAVLMQDQLLQEGLAAAARAALPGPDTGCLDAMPVAACVIENGRIAFANARCGELLGEPAHALRHRQATALVRKDMRAAMEQNLAHAQAHTVPLAPLRVVLERPDGSLREAELMFSAGPGGAGRSQIHIVLLDLTQGRHERAEFEQSQMELRQLSASLVEAREAERRRIARELHDELGQQLSALKMELSTLKGSHETRARSDRIDGMLQMIDETVGSVRRIAADLRPLMLDDLGLSAALDWLAREFSRRMGIKVRLEVDDNGPPVPERASIAVYRMVQEALTNIARHAKAKRARIEIRHGPSELQLTVDDDGVGLPAMAMHRAGSHGLVGMRERCHMLGGELQLGSSPLGGTRISVKLPLQAAAEPLLERRRTDRSGGPQTPPA